MLSGKTRQSKQSLTIANPTYFKYTKATLQEIPVQSRVIKLQEVTSDPLEPPRHRLKKECFHTHTSTDRLIVFVQMPTSNDSPPRTAVHHSPTRTLTTKDRDDWNIPPPVSNWKVRVGIFRSYILISFPLEF